MQELILALKHKGLRVCEAELDRVLRSIISVEDPWQALALSRITFPTFNAILELLQNRGYIDMGLKLTALGKEAFSSHNIRPLACERCPQCDGSGFQIDLDLKQRFYKLISGRPQAIKEYDQGHLTLDSVLRRVALLRYHGDLEDKSIAILGDDDLLGLALALTGLPKRVVVFEIDERVVEFIRRRAKEEGLNLEAIVQDLRHPLPEEHLQSFDSFVTDPLETIEGFLLFFEQGLATLRPGGGRASYFGLTRIEASLGKWHKLQKHLLSYRLAITDILPDFSLYDNWPYLSDTVNDRPFFRRPPFRPWYRSSFFRLETLEGFSFTPQRQKRIKNKTKIKLKGIYTDKEAIRQSKVRWEEVSDEWMAGEASHS